MASKTYTEMVYEGDYPMPRNYEAITVGHHSEPLEYPAQRMADEISKKVGYWDDLEKNIPGVESDFYAAISHQDEEQRRMGRVAVLRMSHPYPPDGGKQTSTGQRQIKWETLRDTAEHAQSSTPAASRSQLAEPPEGLLFEDLDLFKVALKILPRQYDESTVPQFFEKQLIVLEDLGKDWVETVGEVFHVPPHVFALHWASPSLYKRGRAHVPLGQPAEEHFILPYSEILPFEIKEGKDFFKLGCCPVRFVSSDMQQDQNADQKSQQESEATNAVCEAMISYWGRLEKQEEWTAILLVDPQLKPFQNDPNTFQIWRADAKGKTLGNSPFLVSRNRRTPHPDPRPAIRSVHGKFNWMPVILRASFDKKSESILWTPGDLGTESTEGQLHTVHTHQLLRREGAAFKIGPPRNILRTVPYNSYLSMLDQILRAPPSRSISPRSVSHPVQATKFVRRIVLAKMTLIVDTYLRQTYTLTVKAMQNISKIADFDPERLSDKPWQDEWRSEFFNRLWELRGNIELLGFDMENIISLFSDLADNASWPEMTNLGTDFGSESQQDEDESSRHIKIRDQEMEDLKEWKRLEATRKYASGFMERTTNAYLQAATAEGAKFANVQARTSKKIAFLATLFVPASLCAAVLALPGYSGAQGATRFWIFWVVSVPIAIILAISLLYKDIRTHVKEHWNKDKRRSESSKKTVSHSDSVQSRTFPQLRLRRERSRLNTIV